METQNKKSEETFYRPKTRGELLEKLKTGIKCEVVASNVEFTNICLDGWLKFQGQYIVYLFPNLGWAIYELIKKNG